MFFSKKSFVFQQPQGVAHAAKKHNMKINITRYFKLFLNISLFCILLIEVFLSYCFK